jgi:hypothetical protein
VPFKVRDGHSPSMDAVPIQFSEVTQIAIRTGTGAIRPAITVIQGIPHATASCAGFAANPVRFGRYCVSQWLCAAAASGARLARTLGLDRRARNRAVGTEHATVARLRPQHRAAAGAAIDNLAGVRRHGLRFRGGAIRTGDDGFTDHRSSLKHVANVGGSGRIGKHCGFKIVCGEVMTNGEAE